MAATNVPAHIVIHCSASTWGSIDVIDDWHRERGFVRDKERVLLGEPKHVGYQYVIGNGKPKAGVQYEKKLDGVVWRGRGETEVGAHAKGWNHRSVGVCLIGDTQFTAPQMTALYGLVLSLMRRWSIPVSRVIGHCEIPGSGKTCPNLPLDMVRLNLARLETALPRECLEGIGGPGG